MSADPATRLHALSSLERFALRARAKKEPERCELCSAAIPRTHRHVVDRDQRRLLCACAPCALTFMGEARGRFRAVPDAAPAASRFEVTAPDLHVLGAPVGLAFFFRSSRLDRWIGVFPSPAGPAEAELSDGASAWLAAKSAAAGGLEDDVQALLVRCERDGAGFGLVTPIDVCYELTAVLRQRWKGIDGGEDARNAVDAFFARLARRP